MAERITFTPSWHDPKVARAAVDRAEQALSDFLNSGDAEDPVQKSAIEDQLAAARAKLETMPADPPRYFLRLASIDDRDDFEAALDGHRRAGEVPRFVLRDVAIAGVRALVDEADAAQLVELLEAEYGGEALDPVARGQVKEVEDLLARHWPDYAALREQEARRNRALPTAAFAAFVEGWENVTDQAGKPIEFARDDRGRIPDAVLRRINALEMRVVGVEAYRLQYGQSEAGN